jgi:hypothetical protein
MVNVGQALRFVVVDGRVLLLYFISIGLVERTNKGYQVLCGWSEVRVKAL